MTATTSSETSRSPLKNGRHWPKPRLRRNLERAEKLRAQADEIEARVCRERSSTQVSASQCRLVLQSGYWRALSLDPESLSQGICVEHFDPISGMTVKGMFVPGRVEEPLRVICLPHTPSWHSHSSASPSSVCGTPTRIASPSVLKVKKREETLRALQSTRRR